MAGKVAKALQSARTSIRNYKDEIKVVKAARNMDRRELKQAGLIGAGAAGAGAYAGYKAEQYIQTSDKVAADSFLRKGVGGIPTTTIIGAVGAFVSYKRLKGKAALAVTSAFGGMAGGGYLYKAANG